MGNITETTDKSPYHTYHKGVGMISYVEYYTKKGWKWDAKKQLYYNRNGEFKTVYELIEEWKDYRNK